MKITAIKPQALPEVVALTFGRFLDERGYFTETIRIQDLKTIPKLPALHDFTFHQINESVSQKNVIRGLHFQWNPHMGKLVRALEGSLIDVALDIRPESPNFGKAVTYTLRYDVTASEQDWLWIPPGFAHGFVALNNPTRMEYICTGFWNPQCELGIKITDPRIDWSLADTDEVAHIQSLMKNDAAIMNTKDKEGLTLEAWKAHDRLHDFTQSLPKS